MDFCKGMTTITGRVGYEQGCTLKVLLVYLRGFQLVCLVMDNYIPSKSSFYTMFTQPLNICLYNKISSKHLLILPTEELCSVFMCKVSTLTGANKQTKYSKYNRNIQQTLCSWGFTKNPIIVECC